MAKPYISDEEAARIDVDAVAGGYKALRAPSKSSWLSRVLGEPTFLRSRADALREERERSKSRAESSLEAAADTINIVYIANRFTPTDSNALRTVADTHELDYNELPPAQRFTPETIKALRAVADDIDRVLGRPKTNQAAKGGDTRADAKGGDGGQSEDIPPEPGEGASSFLPSAGGGPRIVINPTTFRNRKDALCVAFNEGFRLWMEANDFQPRSEPTDAQRKFFSDTAYADDELQLRRTILARIATFDTSVKDPTDDQLAETAGFLGAVLESDWCKNEWERDCVSRLAQAAQAAVGAEPVEARQEPLEAREAEPLQARAAMGGGETDDEEKNKPSQAVPAHETDIGMDGVTQQDVNGDGTVIDHSADYEAQLDSEHQEDAAEANAEYEKLRQSGALDDNASFDNGGQLTAQKQAQEPAAQGTDESMAQAAPANPAQPMAANPAARPANKSIQSDIVSKDSPGSLSYRGPRKGAIENDIVSKDSPGSLSYRGPRKGAIENDIVSKDSPGSLSYRGPRQGGIENPIVDPTSQGSIGFSGMKNGGIESPIVDPNSPGSLSYRRRRRNRR